MQLSLRPIASVQSLYKEKFGVPKQSQMNQLLSIITIEKHIPMESFEGLEQMSHIWVIFSFHLNPENPGAKVRPPVLGGNTKVGIYSSRSSFRHNNLGLSLVRLVEINFQQMQLKVEGLDCADGTPVVDIKPFHPCADIPKGSIHCGWIEQAENRPQMNVEFSVSLTTEQKQIIEQALKNDPRPSYHFDSQRVYGMTLGEWNVKWKVVDQQTIEVVSLEKL